MQQRFLLQILLQAQHVLGTTMPIIRSHTLQTRYLTHRQKPPSSTLQKTYQEHPHTDPTTLDTPYKKPR